MAEVRQDKAEDIAPTDRRLRAVELAIRIGGGVVATAAALLLAVVESFLVQYRWNDDYIPVATVLAVVGNIGLIKLAWWWTAHRLAALLPAAAWFAVVLFASMRTGEGDLIVSGDWQGLAMVLCGAGAIAIAAFGVVAPPRQRVPRLPLTKLLSDLSCVSHCVSGT